MDYIYSIENKTLLIENVQTELHKKVIQQYKDCRKGKRITQAELSRLTGISQPNITRFEGINNNPTLAMMVKIAVALGMELKIELVNKMA